MAMIFKDTTPGETIGGSFADALKQTGQGFGQGLSSGFQALANMKMQNYMQRQQMGLQREQQQYQQQNNLRALIGLGYSEDKATQMASADPALLREIVKYDMQQKGNLPLAQLLASSGTFGGTGAQAVGGVRQQGIEGAAPQGLEGQPTISTEQLATLPRHDLMQAAQMLGKQKQHAEDLAFKKEQANLKREDTEKTRFTQMHLPQYEELRKRSEGAKEADLALQSMLELVNKGNLPTPTFVKTAQMLGSSPIGSFVDVNKLLGPDAEQYIKDSTKLFTNAKNIFGSRISNFEFQTFLKSIPDIINTDEGKRRIIHGLKKLNDIANARYETAQQIKEENNGYLPKNFDTLLEKRSKKTIDRLSKEFLKGVEYGAGKRFTSINEAKGAPEGTKIRNNKTGQTFIMKDGSWQKMA